MAKRISILVDNDTREILGKMPARARSRVINEALVTDRDWLHLDELINMVEACDKRAGSLVPRACDRLGLTA